MGNIKFDLAIDRLSVEDPSLEKWISFVERYLIFCLKQKGADASIVQIENYTPTADSYLFYLPILTQKSISHFDFIYKTQGVQGNDYIKIKKIALVKDLDALEKAESANFHFSIVKMFLIDPDTGVELSDEELWKKENLNSLLFKIYDLCSELERVLNEVTDANNSAEKKAVYLAQTSPDMISTRDAIRRELLRYGYKVYPENVITGTTKEVEKKINELLQRSVMSVHIFGKLYEDSKSGELPRGELENTLAANYFLNKKDNRKNQMPFKRIIWMPDNLAINNSKQDAFLKEVLRNKKLYAGSEIITSSVEELKDILLERLSINTDNKEVIKAKEENSVEKSQTILVLVKEEKNETGANLQNQQTDIQIHENKNE